MAPVRSEAALGLEFELAADVIGSVISPTWMDIGELGAIAVIRTFLNYFLEQDLDHAEESVQIPSDIDKKPASAAGVPPGSELTCRLARRRPIDRVELSHDQPEGQWTKGNEDGGEDERRNSEDPVFAMRKPVMRGDRIPAIFPTKL